MQKTKLAHDIWEKQCRAKWGKQNPACSICGHTFCDYEVGDNGEPLCTECAEEEIVEFVNLTPHSVTLADVDGKNPFTIRPSFRSLGAEAVEIPATVPERLKGRAMFVATKFVATPEGEELLAGVLRFHPDAIIIGSIIAAQAYPGVCAMVPCVGFERVSPAEKRMRRDKFTIF